MVDVAQLVESRIVIPVVVGSSPIVHPRMHKKARIFELPSKSWIQNFWRAVFFMKYHFKKKRDRFNVRMSSDLHAAIVCKAATHGKSLNDLIVEAVTAYSK